MRCAVQQECHAVGQAARDRDADRRITPHKTTDAADGRGSGKDNQIGDLAAVQRQLHHAKVIHHLADTGGPSFHQRRVRLNLDLVGNLADFENRIDHRVGADLQHDPRLDKRAESGKSRLQPVRTNRKVRECVRAGFVCHDAALQSRLDLCRGDFHAGQYCACLIPDRAADLRC